MEPQTGDPSECERRCYWDYTRIMAGGRGGGRAGGARTASGKVEQTITQLLAHKCFHPKQRLDTG